MPFCVRSRFECDDYLWFFSLFPFSFSFYRSTFRCVHAISSCRLAFEEKQLFFVVVHSRCCSLNIQYTHFMINSTLCRVCRARARTRTHVNIIPPIIISCFIETTSIIFSICFVRLFSILPSKKIEYRESFIKSTIFFLLLSIRFIKDLWSETVEINFRAI